MYKFFLCLLFLLPFQAYAQEQENGEVVTEEIQEESFLDKAKKLGTKVFSETKEAANEVGKTLGETKDFRANSKWTILGNYSLIDTWIPSKYGASVTYVATVESSWELEYLRGSISFPFIINDLGKMTDQKLSFKKRFYGDRNSFNFFIGVGYHDFSVQLGDRLLSVVTRGLYPNIDLLNVQTLGLLGGFGNRWQLESGWVIGIDWLAISLPIKTIKSEAPFLSSNADQNRKNEVEDFLKIIRKVPTFSAIKLQVGKSF